MGSGVGMRVCWSLPNAKHDQRVQIESYWCNIAIPKDDREDIIRLNLFGVIIALDLACNFIGCFDYKVNEDSIGTHFT